MKLICGTKLEQEITILKRKFVYCSTFLSICAYNSNYNRWEVSQQHISRGNCTLFMHLQKDKWSI